MRLLAALCLVTLALCQDDVYDDISDPYEIPILSDNIVRTEPQQQQEVLPLLSENIIDDNEGLETVSDPEEMCRVAGGDSNIVLDIVESVNDDFSQMTSPKQLPITGILGKITQDRFDKVSHR